MCCPRSCGERVVFVVSDLIFDSSCLCYLAHWPCGIYRITHGRRMSQPCVLLPNRPMFNLARATIWPKAKKCPKAIRPSGTLIHGYFDCLCRQFTDTVFLIIQRMGKKSKRQVIRSPKTTSLTPLRLRLNDPAARCLTPSPQIKAHSPLMD